MFDINRPNRVQVRSIFVNGMINTSCENVSNLTHAIATVFDSSLLEISNVESIKVEKLGEITNEEVDAF